MTAGNGWEGLTDLFNAARELPPRERESLLDAQSLDPELRRELDELLRAHDALQAGGEDAFLNSLDPVRAAVLLDAGAIDASRPPPLSPGDTVGRYRIVRSIGRGGMGVIYLASDPRLDRRVALKLLPAHLNVDGNARRRFEEEARAASLLDHPNIATVYEVDETADGRLFIVMAYYDGETLRDRIARGALPITDAVTLAGQVADGLAAAHAAGLVHRDVKPGNVIVTRQGVAKLVDFGIARLATDEITKDAAMAGTVAYMSPEQTRGAPPHPSMDVWSLGVMLYEMLTGLRPFRGDRDAIVIFAIRNDLPSPIEQLRDGVPSELSEIVERCLRKDPAERYPDAGAVAAALRKLPPAGVEPSSADRAGALDARPGRAPERSGRRTWRAAVAVGAALAVIAAGTTWFTRHRSAGRPTAITDSSIAVLPFADESRAGDDAFSAGLADELIAALGAVPGLRVAGRTSTVALYSSGLDAGAIAGRLGVATVLEGSVRRDTARMKISARLVQPRDHVVLWSDSYDVPMRDVFGVQERIARAVVDALNVPGLSPTRESALVGRATSDPAAHDSYLLGRWVRTGDTQQRLFNALAHFLEATKRDPAFAEAYSATAETYVNLANFGYVPATEGFENAERAAQRALTLNPRLAEAHTSEGYVLTSRRDYAPAEREFRRALDLNPNLALGRHYYSLLLAMLGRTDEALEQNRRARELDPLFTPAAADFGIVLCQRGDLAAAGVELSNALRLESKFGLTLYWLGAVRAAEGAYPEAERLLEEATRIAPDYPGASGSLAYVYDRVGRRDAADSIVATLRARATDDRGRVNLAFAYAALGKPDAAFALLQRIDWDVPSLVGLRADPLLRSLRSDPRFAVLVSGIARPTKVTAPVPAAPSSRRSPAR
jgi:TolB-like protein/tetratricopeptide (TPR) repeat protein